ncbi:unnamed protein product [Rhizopus microsporus]
MGPPSPKLNAIILSNVMSLILSIINRDLYTASNICNSCLVMSSGSSGDCKGYKWLIWQTTSAGETHWQELAKCSIIDE